MRLLAVGFVLAIATGCQLDREEAARNRREWLLEPEHIRDPVAFHASDQPEMLDPPGPKPLLGPRRDPDTIRRERRRRFWPLDATRDEWDRYRAATHLE